MNPNIGGGPGESALANLLFDRLSTQKGLEVRRQIVAGERCNIIATLRGSGGGRSLMLNGHMDTVEVSGMTIEPFEPQFEGSLLHGRGACDMKGALAAMVGAIEALVASKSKLRGDVIVSFVVDEEHMSLGMKKLVQEYKADAAIVGEPTDMKIATAHKGFIWIEVETRGRSAHGSVPEKGVDAIAQAAKIVSALGPLQNELRTRVHQLLGSPKIHTSTIQGGTHWAIVPNNCILRLERRTILGESSASVMHEIEEILDNIRLEDSDFNAIARKIYEMPPLETLAGERIVQELQQSVRKITGKDGQIAGVPYWTDGALLASSASIPTCIFGPGSIDKAHSPDEYIDVYDVVRAAEVYLDVAKRFCA